MQSLVQTLEFLTEGESDPKQGIPIGYDVIGSSKVSAQIDRNGEKILEKFSLEIPSNLDQLWINPSPTNQNVILKNGKKVQGRGIAQHAFWGSSAAWMSKQQSLGYLLLKKK
jgi:hypothetical protein